MKPALPTLNDPPPSLGEHDERLFRDDRNFYRLYELERTDEEREALKKELFQHWAKDFSPERVAFALKREFNDYRIWCRTWEEHVWRYNYDYATDKETLTYAEGQHHEQSIRDNLYRDACKGYVKGETEEEARANLKGLEARISSGFFK